ncbi:MAG: LysR family transcriptional regulator [Caulobacteraceae bacterium]|nr:LysR family transcriptional regulator [Caulobacteraceae bacterium]
MDYLAAMKAFVRAVDLGSFSKAAAEAELKVSTVSRYVSALEVDLGAALLNRSTRALHLTEAGSAFYDRAIGILAEVEDARQSTSALNATPQGLLRVAAPGAFGRRHVVPHLKVFRDLYPQVRLDVSLSEATVDLIDTGIDVAVRIGALADSTLIARKLAPHRRLLVASPAYLRQHGAPVTPADLASRPCLMFALQPKDAWVWRPRGNPAAEASEVKVAGTFRANDSDALLQAARDGLGLGLLPSWTLAEDVQAGRLVPLLTEWTWAIAQGPQPAIWGVYPPKKTVSPKVRAFLTFIAERFGAPPYWERGL